MHLKKPDWLKVKLQVSKEYSKVIRTLNNLKLNTVCENALCPNRNYCFSKGTATFLLLGNICTRACRFCNIKKAKKGLSLDEKEPYNILKAVKVLNLDYVVLTSVSRDDLKFQGADVFFKTIVLLKKNVSNIIVEALVPDFQGKKHLIDRVLDSNLDVFNHNIETIERLTPIIRDKRANYNQSLKILEYVASKGFITKSGFMVGLGETDKEVFKAIKDLKDSGCKIITIGQYLQPTKRHYPVKDYVNLQSFKQYQDYGKDLSIEVVASPFVRSSYEAKSLYYKVLQTLK